MSNFMKWGGKKPVHYAEGDFEKRKAIMGIEEYGKGGSKGWTGLTYQAYNRDFNLMKKNMMNEIRSLQGPGSKSRAMGIIKKYKDKAANTGMSQDFAEIAARWEKAFKNTGPKNTGMQSSDGITGPAPNAPFNASLENYYKIPGMKRTDVKLYGNPSFYEM